MKQNDFLLLQLAILTLQHGERAILESLAVLREKTVGDLEIMMVDIEKNGRSSAKKPRATKTSNFSIDSFLSAYPEKATLIRSLKIKYENKEFLAELKDVRRFLDRHGGSTRSLRARNEAFPRVVRVLADLPIISLEEMLGAEPSDEFSGLGVISDQILGIK